MLRVVAAARVGAASPLVDPIYTAIEVHQKAFRGHIDAVHIEFTYEEAADGRWNMNAEQTRAFARLGDATHAAFLRMEEMGIALVTTKPTTLAGIGAVCRYLKSLLEDGTPGLCLENEFGDVESGISIFCDTIAAAVEGL